MIFSNQKVEKNVARAALLSAFFGFIFACSAEGIKPVKVPYNTEKSVTKQVGDQQSDDVDVATGNQQQQPAAASPDAKDSPLLDIMSNILPDLAATPTQENSSDGVVGSSPTASTTPMSVATAAGPVETSNPEATQYDLYSSTKTTIQRKNSVQLRNTISSCLLGENAIESAQVDLFKVKDSMIMSSNMPNVLDTETGRIKFFMPNTIAVGSDIITNQISFIDLASASTGVRGDVVDDQLFLNSMLVIANVVAFNCDLNSVHCKCSTPQDAERMLLRCLPLLNPMETSFKNAVNALSSSEQCGSSDLYQRRISIASLISSYAFATASR